MPNHLSFTISVIIVLNTIGLRERERERERESYLAHDIPVCKHYKSLNFKNPNRLQKTLILKKKRERETEREK